MGLLDNAPVQSTPVQMKAKRIGSRVDAAFAQLRTALMSSVADLYGDPTQTQAVFDEFGPRMAVLFGLSNIAVEAINKVVTVTGKGELITQVVPSDHVVTFSPDGSAIDIYTPPAVFESEPTPPPVPIVPLEGSD